MDRLSGFVRGLQQHAPRLTETLVQNPNAPVSLTAKEKTQIADGLGIATQQADALLARVQTDLRQARPGDPNLSTVPLNGMSVVAV